MFLKYVQIRNFRNHLASKFAFSKGTNTIIGENDSGKSNAMTALRILLDSSYFYNVKQLKETDFSDKLEDWRGEWIIISAMFDNITPEDKTSEGCAELVPQKEDEVFLKSYIRCADNEFGTVTLYIRPIKKVRQQLASATGDEFEIIRKSITLSDYEFYYTSRSQADFLDDDIYKSIVGDTESGQYSDPEEDDAYILGAKIDISDVWKYISLEFIDALRDVEGELKKVKNPLRRVFDIISYELEQTSRDEITSKIHDLNATISAIPQISGIGTKLTGKLNEIVGLVYSPDITVESRLKEDIDSLARYLSISPTDHDDLELLGLGHLNILYIALKLVEFEYGRKHEILNIMVVEEPEAHIHTHIQKTLFDNFKVSKDYTQIIMTTHSNHISEVSDIRRVNVLKSDQGKACVMNPANRLDEFGKEVLNNKSISLSECLERYLDAKRSVLLFSKGVILVEGDGEEILIPAMVKNALGVSLDELGIGLINVGNVAFENIASVFHDDRIQRRCAIITDYDQMLPGATKCKEGAAKRGKSRREKLDNLFMKNKWVKSFYAPYTFEVDFVNEVSNRPFVEEIIKDYYERSQAIDSHISNIEGDDLAKRYDSVLIIANNIGKGWYATLLASYIDSRVAIPAYIIDAIAFAAQDVLSPAIIRKMAIYAIKTYKDVDQDLLNEAKNYVTNEEYKAFVEKFSAKYQDDMLSKLLKAKEECNNDD